jgi:hypothetical protein
LLLSCPSCCRCSRTTKDSKATPSPQQGPPPRAVEHYNPLFRDYFFHFNSWEHLKEITSKPGSLAHDDRVQRGMAFAKRLQAEGLASWRRVFEELGVL